ncbi:hypothetical protein NG895_19955, partial [Aeoliella sp. ICT_H6.2]
VQFKPISSPVAESRNSAEPTGLNLGVLVALSTCFRIFPSEFSRINLTALICTDRESNETSASKSFCWQA